MHAESHSASLDVGGSTRPGRGAQSAEGKCVKAQSFSRSHAATLPWMPMCHSPPKFPQPYTLTPYGYYDCLNYPATLCHMLSLVLWAIAMQANVVVVTSVHND